MSDPTQAQAEDRRAQIQARIKEWFGKEWPCDSGAQQWDEFEQRLQCASCGYPEPDHLLREAFDELTRLSCVEQALRAVGNYMEGENLEFIQVVDPHWAALIRQVRAALSASPSSQPKER